MRFQQTHGKPRADERTRTADLLITSETWVIAWHCSGLLWLAESPYLSRIFFTGLHTIAENCALGDVEVMYIDAVAPSCGIRVSAVELTLQVHRLRCTYRHSNCCIA
jgi:hypothetical protein